MHGAIEREIDLERRLRHQIAAVTLLLNQEGILGYSGHVSARLPDRARLLIQPFEQSRAELRPEHLLVCDMDGRCIAGDERPPSEVFIHTEIYKARPDVTAVAHFHHDLTTSFSLVEGVALRPIKNHAVRWESGIPIHPDPGHVDTPDLGARLAATLGPHHALVIRAHGEVVVAESLPALLMDCIHFVENAQALYQAALLGPILPLTAEEMAGFRRSFKRDRHASKLWAYYVGRGCASGLLPESWTASLAAEAPRPR
jgi:ribulose-5-phosphate 4-epimerase/fuculose-1-phosphate aldolase